MYEVKITGTFLTGTTFSTEEEAKEATVSLLKKHLKEAHLLDDNGIFSFTVQEVSVEKL